MAYPPRNIIPGAFYHLYNRGNHREAIFHSAEDYERFLWAFTDVAAYCLMPNHFHALVRPISGSGLVKMMRSFSVSYSMYYNRSYGQVGHLFQGRYRTRLIRDEADLVNVSRYIHRNPVELAELATYEWSSYRAYLGAATRFCNPNLVLAVFRDFYGGSYDMFCRSVKRSDLTG
jgi:putative transposase